MNRIRGGWLTDLFKDDRFAVEFLEEIGFWKDGEMRFVKDFHDFIFATFFSSILFLDGWHYIVGIFILFFAMDLGKSKGWGNYLGAIVNRDENLQRDDVKIIDWLIFDRRRIPLLTRGIISASLRGLYWTSCLWLGFYFVAMLGYEIPSYWLIPAGLLMGPVYYLAKLIHDKTKLSHAWGLGEFLFGGYLWVIVYFCV